MANLICTYNLEKYVVANCTILIFQVVVAMINLSDEETSNHVDSDVVFKSSTAARYAGDLRRFLRKQYDLATASHGDWRCEKKTSSL